MKKIISLFKRDYESKQKLVYDEIVKGAEWVINGEGIATKKIDGTSCMIDSDGVLWKRHDVKEGRTYPNNWIECSPPDPVTGHHPGWLLVDFDLPENKWHKEAFEAMRFKEPWTYELIGEKVQGNPYKITGHVLLYHGIPVEEEPQRDFESIKAFLSTFDIEGIVWWKDLKDVDCDKVKIKAKDFGVRFPKELEEKE